MERPDFLESYEFQPTAEELISHYLKKKILKSEVNPDLPNAYEFRDVSDMVARKRQVMTMWTPVYSSDTREVVIGLYRVVRFRPGDPEYVRGETWYEYKIDPIGHPEVQGFGWEDWVILKCGRS